MGARDLRRIIAILAAAILLAASAESCGAGPGEQPGTSETSPVADNAAVQDIPADVSPLPFPGTADLSSSPDNAAAQDHTAAGEEVEIREPSFGGSLLPPRYLTLSSRSTGGSST